MSFSDVIVLFHDWPGLCETWLPMKDSNQITVVDGKPTKHDKLTRRGFLGVGAAALAAAGIAPALAADRSNNDPGPSNSALDAQKPRAFCWAGRIAVT